MKQFQYMYSCQTNISAINEFGLQGWQCCGLVGTYPEMLLFMREIHNEDEIKPSRQDRVNIGASLKE